MSAVPPSLREQLDSVPNEPGVYLWKDAEGEVLYVGKAKALRNRMKQYVLGQDEREQIPLMMERTESYDYIVTRSRDRGAHPREEPHQAVLAAVQRRLPRRQDLSRSSR